MAAFVHLNESGAVYGKVSTLLDGCVQCVALDWKMNLMNFECLPASLKDKCLYLMSKRGWLYDENISKLLHDKVRVLDLADCDISDVGLVAICQCPMLCKLDLNSNKDNRTNITSQAITKIARSCPQLQTVYLRRCTNITDDAIVTLSRSCPQLRLLNIGGCKHITDTALQALGENTRFLKSLNVSNTQVTDNGILSLVSGQCANSLTEVHIIGCRGVTDEAIEAVLQFCPHMSILLFHGCPNVTEKSREALEELTLSPMKQVTWTVY